MQALRTEHLLIVALIACLWYPTQHFFAGGVVDPLLLQQDLTGKVAIVTGGNTGIGFETAQQLVKQHATVIIAGRSLERVGEAVERIKRAIPSADVTGMQLDLASLRSVRQFAAAFKERYNNLHYLINNAGVMFPPQSVTEDGFELTFGTNHLGPFLLTDLLLDLLKASAPSRIINLSSRAHERGHIDLEDLNFEKRAYAAGIPVYSQSKLANVLHTKELARRLEGTGVTAVSLHPGVVTTELQRHIPFVTAIGETVLYPIVRTFFKNPWQGTQTTLYTILDPKVPAQAGEYFADCAVVASPNEQAQDSDLARAFWDKSMEMVAAKGL